MDAQILQKMEELNQKMNFVIGGVLDKKYKNPFAMSLDSVEEETKLLNEETADIKAETERDYEEHTKKTDELVEMCNEYFYDEEGEKDD